MSSNEKNDNLINKLAAQTGNTMERARGDSLLNGSAAVLIKKLEAAEFEAYYVGGCVRDMLMSYSRDGSLSGDIDVTTSATPDEMKQVFADCKVFETGIKHGTLTVLAPHVGGVSVEITTFRTEKDYFDGRHPDKVVFVRNLEEDLGRRDFTINAMAMDVRGNLIDLYGGQKDLDAKLIRAVGNPDIRFQEDALRIMRAMRFAATLGAAGEGFAIDAETEATMFRNRELLKNISAERIYTELKKLIVGPYAGIVIRRYVEILGVVIPELLALKGFKQHNPYHKYDVLEHCIRTLEGCMRMQERDASAVEGCSNIPDGYARTAKSTPDNVAVALAALLHDVGKPKTFFLDENGVGHMYGHPIEGEKIARNIMNRLKADRDTTVHVCMLVKHHDLVFQKDEKLLKRWMNRYTPDILLEILQIKRADNLATGKISAELAQKFDDVEKMIHEILEAEEPFSLKDLAVDGRDLITLAETLNIQMRGGNLLGGKLLGGPWIGEILGQLLEEVIDGKVENKKETLLARAKELL